jgi:hypothetical protein
MDLYAALSAGLLDLDAIGLDSLEIRVIARNEGHRSDDDERCSYLIIAQTRGFGGEGSCVTESCECGSSCDGELVEICGESPIVEGVAGTYRLSGGHPASFSDLGDPGTDEFSKRIDDELVRLSTTDLDSADGKG